MSILFLIEKLQIVERLGGRRVNFFKYIVFGRYFSDWFYMQLYISNISQSIRY